MKKRDTDFLNGMRIILALWVAIGHFYYHVGGTDFVKFPLWHVVLYPGPGVDGFIAITGFLMTYHYTLRQEKDIPSKPSTWIKFYLKRFFRLYPVYLVIILIGYFSFNFINQQSVNMHHYFYGEDLQSFTYGATKSVNLSDLFTHLTFIHGLFPQYNASIIGPAWSLSTEVQFYLLFPWIFLLFNTTKKFFHLTVISIILYVITHKLYGVWEAPGSLGTFGAPSLLSHKMIYFTFGIAMAKYKLDKSSINPVLLILLAISFITVTYISTVVCFILYVLMFTEKHKNIIPDFLYNILKKINCFLSLKVMDFGANISYSLYLIHTLLIPVAFFITISYFDLSKTEIVLWSFSLFLTLTILLSWLLYIYVEKPFIRLGQKILNRK